MTKQKRITFISLLSLSFIVLIIIFLKTFQNKNENSKTIIAKVNGHNITNIELEYYLKKMIGVEVDIAFQDIPKDQLNEILKQYTIDKHILKSAKHKKIAKDPKVKNQIIASTDRILKESYLEKLTKKKISNQDINNIYEEKVALLKKDTSAKYEYRVKHILIKDLTQANDIVKSIKANQTSFEVAAETYSLDKASAKNGGDLGYFPQGVMVKTFEDKITALSIDQISQPFKTQFGWHIAKLVDKRKAKMPNIENLRNEIIDELKIKIITEYIDNLIKDIEIEILVSKADS